MSHDAQKVTYQEVTIFDRPALFTECRIDRATVPEGVYRYELRHGDEDWGEPRELARGLMVNFYGTVLTREPFQLPIDGWIPLESGSLSFQDGGCRTLAEFQEKYPASEKDVIDFYSFYEPALHALYFSRSEEQDESAGCVGHLRGDFGSGKQFYTTWWPHQHDALNTPEFKADIDRTVNWLREQSDSPLRDFDSMNRYCNRYEQICAIKGALLPSCGFMVKTKQYVYITYGMDLLVNIFDVCSGIVATAAGSIGGLTGASVALPQEIADAIGDVGFLASIPLWLVTLLGSLFITVLAFIMILTVYGRFFKIYMYAALSPVALASFAGEGTSHFGKAFLRSYVGVCMEGAVIVLACIIFSAFSSSGTPVVDSSASVVTQVWSYLGEVIFNLLVLVGLVKSADHIAKEMLGL